MQLARGWRSWFLSGLLVGCTTPDRAPPVPTADSRGNDPGPLDVTATATGDLDPSASTTPGTIPSTNVGDAGAFTGYPVGHDPDPKLPSDGTLDMLIVGDAGIDPLGLANNLQSALVERPEFSSVRVDGLQLEGWGGLPNLVWGWTGRDQRLAALDDGYDYIVLFETAEIPIATPQANFAAVLALSDHIRSLGATPVLVMSALGRPRPDAMGQLCSNHCMWANNDNCNDGAAAANTGTAGCGLGSDCADCGVRSASDATRMSVQEQFWRTAIGTGVIPVAASDLMGELEATWGHRRLLFTAALYSAITGDSIGEWTGWLRTDDWPERADAMQAHLRAQESIVHYDAPAKGQVRIGSFTHRPQYAYMTSGTSSEAGYSAAMSALLSREGYAPRAVEIGTCTPHKHVDAECMQRVATQSQQDVYLSLFARGYSVSQAAIHAAIGSELLQTQVYDRHTDDTPSDGIAALDDLFNRFRLTAELAVIHDHAWLPQHINFAKYKLATQQPLLSDGVHATDAVQAGIAAMSYVSRTGRSPSRAGVDANSAKAMELGEHTIRTMATYSRTGIHIPDVPAARPSFR